MPYAVSYYARPWYWSGPGMARSKQFFLFLLSSMVVLTALPGTTGAQAASYYVEAGAYGTQRESDPPRYVRKLDSGSPDWLEFGLEFRMRYEYRDDDLRRLQSAGLDDPLLLRTRAWFGVQTPLAPLKLVAEFTDSRSYYSRFASNIRDVNEAEFIQGYAELDYPQWLGTDARGNPRGVTLRAGRMAFELLDRRLLARNEWRNTTNNFDGVRASVGQQANDWQLELMTLHPVQRLLTAVDKPDRNQRLDVVVGHWRSMSPALTLEPHYLQLEQHASVANGNRHRTIHATGLRVYGKLLQGAFSYDVSLLQQRGNDGTLQHRAQGLVAESGYSWLQHAWRPRLSLFLGYGSGDRDPFDQQNNRFERFFGFARPWSANDYITWENLKAPKLRLEFQPSSTIRIDMGYSRYWLASAQDRFNNLLEGSAFNRDASGTSGDYLGDEFDARVRIELGEHLDANIGYTHFRNGDFVQARQSAASGASASDSDFLYLELSLSLF